MFQTESIIAPKTNVIVSYDTVNKPFVVGAYIFNTMILSTLVRTKPPLCGCGCGEVVKKAQRGNKWNTYCKNHNRRGKTCTLEHRRKVGDNPYRQTAEYKEKQRIAQTGRKDSEETKKKKSESGKRKPPVSQETKNKQSIAGKSRPHPIESMQAAWKASKGSHHTQEQNDKVSKAAKERYRNKELNPNWRGGISSLPYHLEFNKQLKDQIRYRDNFTCQICGKSEFENKTTLSVHHIDYDKLNTNCNLLITLCTSCHGKTSAGNREYWQTTLIQIMKENGTYKKR